MHVLIVGAGITGTAHALEAIRRGHTVAHVERDPNPRGASPRSHGFVRVSGTTDVELPAVLESRALWEELGGRIPGVGFRPAGSLTLVRTAAELAVAEEAVACDRGRGYELLEPGAVRSVNPAVRGSYLAGLYCPHDATVEPRYLLPAIRGYLEGNEHYTFHTAAIDAAGTESSADLVLLCTGADHAGGRRVRMQMMTTAPRGESLPTALADGDSFRYYAGYAGPASNALQHNQSRPFAAAAHDIDLLCVQHVGGGLTIGSTRQHGEPFAFDLDEAPYAYLTDVVEHLLGRRLPPIVARWAGTYAEPSSTTELVAREQRDDRTWCIGAAGSRGLTFAPFVAQQTADRLGL